MAKHRRFVRSMTDRVFGGVGGGIGAYVGLNPLWVRLLFVILVPVTMGYALLLYLLLWLVMPAETLDDLPPLTPVKPGEATPPAAPPRGSSIGQVTLGVAVMLIGVVFLAFASGVLPVLPGDLFWPVAALTIGAALIWRQVRGG